MIVLLALVQFEAAAVNISTSTSVAKLLVWKQHRIFLDQKRLGATSKGVNISEGVIGQIKI